MPEDSSQPRTSRERAQERTKAWWRRHPRLAMAVAGGLGAAAVVATVQFGPRGCQPPPPNIAWPSCHEVSDAFKQSAELDGYDPARWITVLEWRHGARKGWAYPGECKRLHRDTADAVRANPDAFETRCAVVEVDEVKEDWAARCSEGAWAFGEVGAYIVCSPATQGIDFFPSAEDCQAKCGVECAA